MPATYANHYAALAIPTSASTAEVHAAFRRQALIHHPDKGGDAARFLGIRKAQKVLGNEHTRARYDAYRRLHDPAVRMTGRAGGANAHLDDLGDKLDRVDEQVRDLGAQMREFVRVLEVQRAKIERKDEAVERGQSRCGNDRG
ncbi:hypothetical protein LTR36_000207 [Oleoguttula mirabilis]|uniref:J domain-containing protein n=1 Tax=Oleoguttula mirabilis TaxID=1507867 RepID=A0AAV9JYI2_9PEZI|nr:hypothetical protein LTR36_000207 [Oleoguttula mirabilis]